jgi:hypothetical protein
MRFKRGGARCQEPRGGEVVRLRALALSQRGEAAMARILPELRKEVRRAGRAGWRANPAGGARSRARGRSRSHRQLGSKRWLRAPALLVRTHRLTGAWRRPARPSDDAGHPLMALCHERTPAADPRRGAHRNRIAALHSLLGGTASKGDKLRCPTAIREFTSPGHRRARGPGLANERR